VPASITAPPTPAVPVCEFSTDTCTQHDCGFLFEHTACLSVDANFEACIQFKAIANSTSLVDRCVASIESYEANLNPTAIGTFFSTQTITGTNNVPVLTTVLTSIGTAPEVLLDPPCCGQCTVDADAAQVFYWPTPNPNPNVTAVLISSVTM
jgi:hypothetical protein